MAASVTKSTPDCAAIFSSGILVMGLAGLWCELTGALPVDRKQEQRLMCWRSPKCSSQKFYEAQTVKYMLSRTVGCFDIPVAKYFAAQGTVGPKVDESVLFAAFTQPITKSN